MPTPELLRDSGNDRAEKGARPALSYLQLLENVKAINSTNNGGEGGGEAYARVDTHSVTIHYPEIVKPTFYYFI